MVSKIRKYRFLSATSGAAFAALLYIVVSWLFMSSLWQRKEQGIGFGTSWWEGSVNQLFGFPSFTVGLSRHILVVPLLNGIFWGALVFVALLWLLKRKVAA